MAERVAVQHCAELLRSAAAPFDLGAACAEFTAEYALALPERLQTFLIGARPLVSTWPAEALAASALASSWSAPSIHYALTLGAGLPPFVVSFDNALALSLTDRLFGGSGAKVDDAPAALPQSVVLSVEQIARAVAETLAPLFGASPAQVSTAAHPVLRRLGVFKRNEKALSLSFTVEQDGHDPWTLRLSAPEVALRAVLEQRASGAAPAPKAAPDPLATAMAAIPLPLTAVLAELAMPLERLAALRPGDAIPLSPRRDVPLLIGSRVIASGTIGAIDERVALRLTRIS